MVALIVRGVLVPAHLARPLLELAVAEAQRRHAAGRVLGGEMRELLGELARVAQDSDGPHRAAGRAAQGRTPIIDGVTTKAAAEALGIDQRTVRKRIESGRLRAERSEDGSWLVDIGEAS